MDTQMYSGMDAPPQPPLVQQHKLWAVLYGIFLVALLVDIGGSFHIKYAAFLVVVMFLVISALQLRLSVPLSFFIIEGLLFGVAPVLLVFITVAIYSVPPALAFAQLSPYAMWLLYPALIQLQPRSRLLSTFTQVMFVGAALTVAMFGLLIALFQSGRLDLIHALNDFMDSHRLGFFGERPLGDQAFEFFPNVYFRWTLLLVPAAVLTFGRRTYQFLFFVAGILATVSTAAILFLFVGIVWVATEMVVRRDARTSHIVKSVALILLLLLFINVGLYATGRDEIVTFVLSKLSPGSISTSIRVGHIESIVELVSRSLWTLLFGTGVGSTFYSVGTSSVVGGTEYAVEVSHFDLVRQFGLLYASAFTAYCVVLFVAVRRIDGQGRLLAVSLVVLFLAAGTNPLLISPVFFLILVMSRAYVTLAAHQEPHSITDVA